MLARKLRLPAATKFKNSHTFREDMFTVKFQENNLIYARFGFVVAKTIDKRAVVRNALKRMVRGHIESTHLGLEKGVDVLFILRPAIKNIPQEQVYREIDEAMQKVKSL